MSQDRFTDPEDSRDEWVDVRMQDPDEGEWELDAVVLDGRVEYVDLRIRPELLPSFVGCLVEDLDESASEEMISTLVVRHDIDVPASEGPAGNPNQDSIEGGAESADESA